MSKVLRYTLLRLVIFGACFGVLWLLFGATGVSNWLLALMAVLFASGLSMLLLRRQAVEAGQAVQDVVARGRGRFESSVQASSQKEDAELDGAVAAESGADASDTVGSTAEQTDEQPARQDRHDG